MSMFIPPKGAMQFEFKKSVTGLNQDHEGEVIWVSSEPFKGRIARPLCNHPCFEVIQADGIWRKRDAVSVGLVCACNGRIIE